MNRLTFKDYLIIYLIILIVVSFIAGFFIGAKTMENELKNQYNYTNFNPEEEEYLEDEITIFYNQIFSPARLYNIEAYEMLKKDKLNQSSLQSFINSGNKILANCQSYSFRSTNLTISNTNISDNINQLLNFFKTNNENDTQVTINAYLLSQKEFYRSLWIWEQSLNPKTKIVKESLTDWKTWNKASVNQKNYIVSAILENKSINTFNKPEDITVHIDSFIRNNNKDISIDLEDLINYLILSDSIIENNFIKSKELYDSEILLDLLSSY